jgi:hypothetical protein
VGEERLGPSYFFISLAYLPQGIYGARLLFFVSARTNKRHHHHHIYTTGVVPVDAVEVVVPVVGDVVAVGVGVLGVEGPHHVIVVDVEGVELDEGVIHSCHGRRMVGGRGPAAGQVRRVSGG